MHPSGFKACRTSDNAFGVCVKVEVGEPTTGMTDIRPSRNSINGWAYVIDLINVLWISSTDSDMS